MSEEPQQKDLFLGHPINYWLELQGRADKDPDVPRLIQEIAELRGQLSFCQNRIQDMMQCLNL